MFTTAHLVGDPLYLLNSKRGHGIVAYEAITLSVALPILRIS